MMSKRLLASLATAATASLALGAITASAQVVQYNARAVYNAANPVNSITTFENYAPNGTTYPGGVTIDGVTYNGLSFPTGAPSVPEIAEGTGLGSPGNWVLFANNSQFLNDSLRLDLPANTFSFGTDFKNSGVNVAEPFKFTLFSGATNLGSFFSSVANGSTFSFIGFTSLSQPITAVQIQVSSAIGAPDVVVDNVTIAVPEPSTWIGLLSGGAVLFGLQRSRRKR